MGRELYSEQREVIIDLKGIVRNYSSGDSIVKALKPLDLHVAKGEFIGIMGPSASGKSTLLNIIGCLDAPTEGDYILNGSNINNLTGREKASIRNEIFGFIFQSFHLITQLDVAENIALPLKYSKVHKHVRSSMVDKVLNTVGLNEIGRRYPDQLSGGQQQRVAIARALVNNPDIILADEPTGNLDLATGQSIMEELKRLNEETGKTIIVITHDSRIAGYAKRLIRLEDGIIKEDIYLNNHNSGNRLKPFLEIEEGD